MTQEHPITPPSELVEQWLSQYFGCPVNGEVGGSDLALATQAARWGADLELEACCEVLRQKGVPAWSLLRAFRRPKPPSLKQQALALIDGCTDPHGDHLDDAALDTIRRALEALPDA